MPFFQPNVRYSLRVPQPRTAQNVDYSDLRPQHDPRTCIWWNLSDTAKQNWIGFLPTWHFLQKKICLDFEPLNLECVNRPTLTIKT